MTIDNPPVNPLSSGVRQGLSDGIGAALADDNVQAIVLTGEGRAFIAGADISEFGGKPEGPSLHDCLTTMDDSSKPIVAAINGTAFGGGLEVALCCHYRVIAPTAPVGLPEVKLGLLPGAGARPPQSRNFRERAQESGSPDAETVRPGNDHPMRRSGS